MSTDIAVVVPWHDESQKSRFLKEWGIRTLFGKRWLFLEQDKEHKGCAVTKNRGVFRAMQAGYEKVWVLDDDCYPCDHRPLDALANIHSSLLDLPTQGQWFTTVTTPPSRGTPYNIPTRLPAAVMGFWTDNGDYDAVHQLVHGPTHKMTFNTNVVDSTYFPLCGMNLSFKPKDWLPWCQFIDVPRFDDIWMGWLWQHEAYRRGYCFRLDGPKVRHSRQSNVWKNLQLEVKYLERNETLWQEIRSSVNGDYTTLRNLLPA